MTDDKKPAEEENWPLTTERIAYVLADVRKTPRPHLACCMDEVDRVRFQLHIIAEKALAELLDHRATQTASAERVRSVVREACQRFGYTLRVGDIDAISDRVSAQLTAPGRDARMAELESELAASEEQRDVYRDRVQLHANRISELESGLRAWRADVVAAGLGHGWQIIERIDALLGWAIGDGDALQPGHRPQDHAGWDPSKDMP